MIITFIKKLFGLGGGSTANPSGQGQPGATGSEGDRPRRRRSRGGRGRGRGAPNAGQGAEAGASPAATRDAPESRREPRRDDRRGGRGEGRGPARGPRRDEDAREERGPPRAAPQPPKPRPVAVDSTAPTYESFALAPQVMQGVSEAGFTHCTPIQAQTLPSALVGRDVAGQAQTGTGKTAAFLVSMFQTLVTRPPREGRSPAAIRGICIAPTRELAVQIHNDAVVLGKYTGLRLCCVFGGVDYDKQRKQFEDGCDVLIGTPGRIIDFYKQGVFDLRHVEVVVLDEADRMFDLGFIDDIRYMLRKMPPPAQRQSMLFSATLSQRVLELAYEDMNEPDLVRIEPDR
ncbi:MAG: hypothetical protein RLZZ393_186, partial [Pseudomonadota bacterium]